MRFLIFILQFNLILPQLLMASQKCQNTVSDQTLTDGITNAKIEVSSYAQPNARTLDTILVSLGSGAIRYISQLKPGSVVIDSGSGFSIASAQLAIKKMKVFAINAQNAWEYFSLMLNQNPNDPKVKKIIAVAISDLGVSIKGTDLKTKNNGHGPWVDIDNAKSKDLRTVGLRLLDKLRGLFESGHFNYVVNFSDIFLKTTENAADLIIDNWGAIFYSPNRTLLFDSYFKTLKPGGKAFLKIRDSYGHGVIDEVIIKSGKTNYKISLIEYLVENYPDIFSVDNYRSTLIIKKTHQNQKLNLQAILKKQSEEKGEMNNGTFPIVTWEFINTP
ncbi:MAG: hypothetical protein ACK5V3_09605 [Bdellovibrionales bacterium]